MTNHYRNNKTIFYSKEFLLIGFDVQIVSYIDNHNDHI